jgi:hypothetical protein
MRARRLSLSEIRENALASIAAMAIRIAASAAVASMQVVNLSIALRLRVIALNNAFPLARWTLARHFPGSLSKAFTTNCLYSTTPIPRPGRLILSEIMASYGRQSVTMLISRLNTVV